MRETREIASSFFPFFLSLSSSPTILDWTINNTVNSILSFREFLLNCNFSWVKREYNSTVHVAAKLSLSSFKSFCFNKLNLPDVLRIVCEANCSALLWFDFIYIEVYLYKKKKNVFVGKQMLQYKLDKKKKKMYNLKKILYEAHLSSILFLHISCTIMLH